MISFLFLTNATYAADITQEWMSEIYGTSSDKFRDCLSTSDGDIVVVGLSNSIDAGFDALSTKSYSDAIIAKFDLDGNLIWITGYGASSTDSFVKVIETSDKGFIAAGYSYSSDNPDYSNTSIGLERCGILVKFNANGKHVWTSSFSGDYRDEYSSVTELTDGSVVAVGFSRSKLDNVDKISSVGITDAIISKVDKDGNLKWTKMFGGTNHDMFYDVVNTLDGGFVAVGETASMSADFYEYDDVTCVGIAVKFNSDAEVVWTKTFCTPGKPGTTFESIIRTYDGGFVISGYNMYYNDDNQLLLSAMIYKCSSLGKTLWDNLYIGNGDESFVSVVELSNRELVAVGYTSSTNLGFNVTSSAGIVIKYSSSGNFVSSFHLNGLGKDEFRGVTQSVDNALIIVGYSDSSDLGFTNTNTINAMIVKYSPFYEVVNENFTATTDLLIAPTNTLEVVLYTQKVEFVDFTGVSDMQLNEAIKLKVSSSLIYNIDVSINGDIVGLRYGKKIKNSMFAIKNSSDTTFKSFSNTSVNLVKNHSSGENIEHNMDVKIFADSTAKVDTYKVLLLIEVYQI